MPIKLKTKEIGTNTFICVLEIPKRVIPSSSGRGEAIINPPKIGKSHFRKPKWNDCKKWPRQVRLINFKISSETVSLINKKRMRSPHSAPKAPQSATKNTEPEFASSTNATEAIAIVNTEVKNIPAKKLPKIFNSRVKLRKVLIVFKRTKIYAKIILKTTMQKSLNKRWFNFINQIQSNTNL